MAETSSSLRRSRSWGGGSNEGGVPRVDSNAIHAPSGDQVGYMSLLSGAAVRLVSPDPSASITHTS